MVILPNEIIRHIINYKQIPKYAYLNELKLFIKHYEFVRDNIILCIAIFDSIKIRKRTFNDVFFTSYNFYKYGLKSPNVYFNGVTSEPRKKLLDVNKLIMYIQTIQSHYYKPNIIIDVINDFNEIFIREMDLMNDDDNNNDY